MTYKSTAACPPNEQQADADTRLVKITASLSLCPNRD